MNESYDYIVVGAGSAGSVPARRLSDDPGVTVCLIEAGGSDASPRVQVPAGTITLYKIRRFSWNCESAPQTRLNGRSLPCPRQGAGWLRLDEHMIYIRGFGSDYERWAAAGCTGWGWQDVRPCFRRSEGNCLGQDPALHGRDGPLQVDRPRDPNPVSRWFVEAGRRMGLPVNTDFNGPSALGVGVYDLTQRDGASACPATGPSWRRCAAAPS